MQPSTLMRYLAECRELVLAEIRDIVPNNRYKSILYDLMLEYPLRLGKGFRPSLCIATCRALGGRLQAVLRTAAVLELYHNAFLLHDDVEDGSLLRRGYPTLHREYGVPIAVNVGDAMNALCLQPLLDNMHVLGMGKALRIIQVIARMARESVEGQAIELDWVRRNRWNLRDRDYALMTYKKMCWYTFIAPMQIGALIAGAQAAIAASSLAAGDAQQRAHRRRDAQLVDRSTPGGQRHAHGRTARCPSFPRLLDCFRLIV